MKGVSLFLPEEKERERKEHQKKKFSQGIP
jgi:hypothetical protein